MILQTKQVRKLLSGAGITGLRNSRQKAIALGEAGDGGGVSEKLIVTYSGILSHNFGGLKFSMVGVFFFF